MSRTRMLGGTYRTYRPAPLPWPRASPLSHTTKKAREPLGEPSASYCTRESNRRRGWTYVPRATVAGTRPLRAGLPTCSGFGPWPPAHGEAISQRHPLVRQDHAYMFQAVLFLLAYATVWRDVSHNCCTHGIRPRVCPAVEREREREHREQSREKPRRGKRVSTLHEPLASREAVASSHVHSVQESCGQAREREPHRRGSGTGHVMYERQLHHALLVEG